MLAIQLREGRGYPTQSSSSIICDHLEIFGHNIKKEKWSWQPQRKKRTQERRQQKDRIDHLERELNQLIALAREKGIDVDNI